MSEEKQCKNCKHGVDGAIYIFCVHPDRFMTWMDEYYNGIYPRGGIPQSKNHTCDFWEVKNNE